MIYKKVIIGENINKKECLQVQTTDSFNNTSTSRRSFSHFHLTTGQPLSKQVSHSLITPSSLSGYTQFFKQNSFREEGWADVKIDKDATWRKMYFIFDDSVLKYGSGPQAPPSSFASIPMDNVMSLRADVSAYYTSDF